MDEIAALTTDSPAADEISSGMPAMRPIAPSRRVKELIAQACEIDSTTIAESGQLLAYGMDSVRAIDLLVSLEETFRISIPERDAIRLRTVRDVIRCVEEKTSR
jgi:acyl carrier protein